MYNSLSRRRGSKLSAGAHARQGTTDPREENPAEFLRRHERESAEAARGNKAIRTTFANGLFPRIADPRNIYGAITFIAQNGGDSPGPNGVRPRVHLGRNRNGGSWHGRSNKPSVPANTDPDPTVRRRSRKGRGAAHAPSESSTSRTALFNAGSPTSFNHFSTHNSKRHHSASDPARDGSTRCSKPR